MSQACMLDGHRHDFSVAVTDWMICETCEGSGRDPDAGHELDDIVFPECFDCGGDGGFELEYDAACSVCGVTQAQVCMMEGP